MKRTVFLLVIYCGLVISFAHSQNPTSPAAQVRLGNQYLNEKDYASAMTWFRKAAEQGNPIAQNNIGFLYEKGFGVPQDYAGAMTWFVKAANQNYALAQTSVGWLYRRGFGVKQDYSQALSWYRKAADQGEAKAQASIGWLYEKGYGVTQDYAQALNWYQKAADQGNTDAQVGIGWLYQNGWGVKQDYVEAMKWYLGPAQKGDAYAQNDIGLLYEKGLGVDRDYSTAMAWYFRAADQGDAQAQTNLGLLYKKGIADKQDYAKAMTWFRKASDQGFAKAQVNLGELYQQGLGVAQDSVEAMAWYRKAADQGYADAQIDIGLLYQNGIGVKQDYGEAMAWFRKAAAQGNATGQNNIGWLYQNGWGVTKDDAEAMNWYRKAAEQGDPHATGNLESLLPRGTIASVTPPSSNPATAPVIMLPGGIRAPHLTYDPEPEYSEEARKALFSGTAFLAVTVGADGLAHNIRNLVPVGYELDEKAIAAVKAWKFDPAMKDAKPVAVEVVVQINFQLYQQTGVGEVELVGDLQTVDARSFLSSLIHDAGTCWDQTAKDKAHEPSIKKGRVTIQFAIQKDGQAKSAEIVSPSGDEALDHDARECVSGLRAAQPLPAELNGKDLIVRMQLLYNMPSVSLNPDSARIAAGRREQFYVETSGSLHKAADWSVMGAGCEAAACGTISSDGLYTAPSMLPDPAYVRVKATLAGANPVSATAVVVLFKDK